MRKVCVCRARTRAQTRAPAGPCTEVGARSGSCTRACCLAATRGPAHLPSCRRYGLSEAELKDVLSLDDELLQAVYQDWTLPSQELLRFPPLLWVRLRRDLGCCLARRPGDGCTLLAITPR